MRGRKKFDLALNTPPDGYKASLRSRIIVAAILLAILLPAFILGDYVFLAIGAVFAALAICEVSQAPRRRYGWYVYVVNFVIVLSYIYWAFIKANVYSWLTSPDTFSFSLGSEYFTVNISCFTVITSLFAYFLIALLDKNFGFEDVAYFFTMTFLIGIGFQCTYALRYYPTTLAAGTFKDYIWAFGKTGAELIGTPYFSYLLSALLLFFVVAGAVMNDLFAYFGGIYFGKHKLNERVSPHKTWEGFAFGLAGSWIFNLAFGLSMAAAGIPILPCLDMEHWYWILLLSLAIPLLGDLGDLSFSLVKRALHIKDYGNILRGHGGILDRIDSILFSAVGAMAILIFIQNGWNFFV